MENFSDFFRKPLDNTEDIEEEEREEINNKISKYISKKKEFLIKKYKSSSSPIINMRLKDLSNIEKEYTGDDEIGKWIKPLNKPNIHDDKFAKKYKKYDSFDSIIENSDILHLARVYFWTRNKYAFLEANKTTNFPKILVDMSKSVFTLVDYGVISKEYTA